MAGGRLLRARRARARSSCATPSCSTGWSSSCCGARRRRPGTWPAATPARCRSATPRSSGSARTPRRCSARGGGCRRGSASLVGAGAGDRRRASSSAFSATGCAAPTSCSRRSRSRRCCSSSPAAGAASPRGSEGIPVPFRPGLLDARHRGQARLGLPSSSSLAGPALPGRSSTSSARAAATSSRRCARTRTPRCRSACRRGG